MSLLVSVNGKSVALGRTFPRFLAQALPVEAAEVTWAFNYVDRKATANGIIRVDGVEMPGLHPKRVAASAARAYGLRVVEIEG